MSRRGILISVLAVGLAVIGNASSAEAAGGLYNVVKCHPWHVEADEIEQAGGHPSYATVNDCNASSPDPKIGIYNTGAAGNNSYSQFMFTARPGTHIETACMDTRLRRDSHHKAEIVAFPGFQVLASGGDDPEGWVSQCFDINHTQLVIRLACSEAGGCPAGPNAHAYARNVVLTMADEVDPSVTVFSGTLLGGGWVRGSRTLTSDAADLGSGVYQLVDSVNGVGVAHAEERCSTAGLAWNFSANFLPCPLESDSLSTTLDTATGPFVNGANTVVATASDYGANADQEARTVYVDNALPQGAFGNGQQPDDPELITASVSDVHSGVSTAQISYRAVGASVWQPLETELNGTRAEARVESSGVPAGEYEFRLLVSDVAGNQFETTLRDDGSPMRLSFPLRSPVELRTSLGPGGSSGQTVPYGTASQVHGRLLDAHGNPLVGEQVLVVDKFDNGALYPRAERPVTTDDEGRFSTPEPAGPTRAIEAVFAGDNRFLPAASPVGKFAVRSSASFTTSAEEIDEGTTLLFKGRVRHHGARIPAGGKLVEVQYRLKPGRQRTLKQPFRTEPDGSYRLAYRFSKALTADALFRFRLRIRGEGNWPFKGSASKWRKVIVRAH